MKSFLLTVFLLALAMTSQASEISIPSLGIKKFYFGGADANKLQCKITKETIKPNWIQVALVCTDPWNILRPVTIELTQMSEGFGFTAYYSDSPNYNLILSTTFKSFNEASALEFGCQVLSDPKGFVIQSTRIY